MKLKLQTCIVCGLQQAAPFDVGRKVTCNLLGVERFFAKIVEPLLEPEAVHQGTKTGATSTSSGSLRVCQVEAAAARV